MQRNKVRGKGGGQFRGCLCQNKDACCRISSRDGMKNENGNEIGNGQAYI